ncbi:MAG: hypothetical protein ABEL76_12080 [Bradymonadaceae bacterium]
MSRFELAACWLAAAVFAAGCGPTLERDTAPSSGEDARTGLSGDSIPAASRLTGRTLEADLEDGRVDLRPGIRFRQVGLTFDGRAPLEFRARRPAGGWTAWRTVETTWREGPAAVGRILLKTPADHLQLRTTARSSAARTGEPGIRTRSAAVATTRTG